ncbi:hypothetical protein GIS00_17500 [Nakamurella sp. YIM 132087]|uniref:Uncharacterized protein n=1 Tax=Nakamurella alba TaxID=2665158 RepID=A0A7K1FNI7_9ACTN|nr:hypothetical protein [Nakamurella alba]MTD15732.1 hypothetical protein [Nakamurella alba]
MSQHSLPRSADRSAGRRFAPMMVVAGIVGALLLSLSMTGTLSAFTAAITNTTNTAGSGTLILREVGGANSCVSSDSTASCATINKYGGSTTLVPSDGVTGVSTTTVNFTNTGTATAASFTLKANACTQSGTGTATTFCSKLNVKIATGATTLFNGTATALATQTAATPIAVTVPTANAGSTVAVTFTVWLDSTADNTFQGLQASQPLVWTLAS